MTWEQHPRALRTQGNPNGICPQHMMTNERCGMWCTAARKELYLLEQDYIQYWRSIGLRWPKEKDAAA